MGILSLKNVILVILKGVILIPLNYLDFLHHAMILRPLQRRNYRMMVSLADFKTLDTILNTLSLMIIMIQNCPSFEPAKK